jgi:hypothetical protein
VQQYCKEDKRSDPSQPGESQLPEMRGFAVFKKNELKKNSKRNWSSNAFRETLAAYGFLMPNFLGFAIFTAIPVIVSLYMAFTYWNIFSKPVWIGLDNFKSLLWFRHDSGHIVANDPFFWQYAYNTVYFMIGIPLGMAGSAAKPEDQGCGVFQDRIFPSVGLRRCCAHDPLEVYL